MPPNANDRRGARGMEREPAMQPENNDIYEPWTETEHIVQDQTRKRLKQTYRQQQADAQANKLAARLFWIMAIFIGIPALLTWMWEVSR